MSTNLHASYQHLNVVSGINKVWFSVVDIPAQIYQDISQVPDNLIDSLLDTNAYGEENVGDTFIYLPEVSTWICSGMDCWLAGGYSKLNQKHPNNSNQLCVMHTDQAAIFLEFDKSVPGHLLASPVADYYITTACDAADAFDFKVYLFGEV